MWRRILSPKTLTLTLAAATGKASGPCRSAAASRLLHHHRVSPSASLLFTRYFSAESGGPKKIEDIPIIATGHEREELEAEIKGEPLDRFDHPAGPFGTKEAPAIIHSRFDKRIVGCPGGEGDDEHDVVWFWLQKDRPFECPVCTQYFKLEVIGHGGLPHDDGEDDPINDSINRPYK